MTKALAILFSLMLIVSLAAFVTGVAAPPGTCDPVVTAMAEGIFAASALGLILTLCLGAYFGGHE